MLNVNKEYIVRVYDHIVPVIVENYSPGVPSRLSGPIDDWYPSEEETFDWYVNTDNHEFNRYLPYDKNAVKSIEAQILKQIHELQQEYKKEAAISKYENNLKSD